jgi:hypothetical protein
LECKAFVVFEQSPTTSTAPLLQVPEKQSLCHSTSHLFKKQWLCLNPTFQGWGINQCLLTRQSRWSYRWW